jgi:hypothetical protein
MSEEDKEIKEISEELGINLNEEIKQADENDIVIVEDVNGDDIKDEEQLKELEKVEIKEEKGLTRTESFIALKLTEKGVKMVDAARLEINKWDLKEPEKKFLSDVTIYRFLKGYKWVLKDALKALKETCEWRVVFQPQKIQIKDCGAVAKQGHLFLHGYDLKSRPVLYLQMGKDKDMTEKGWKDKISLLAYWQEKSVSLMKPGVTSCTWVIDLKGIAGVDINTVKSVKDMFIKLGDHYSERLHSAIIVNVPFYINIVWNFLKVFISKSTLEKFIFVSGSNEKQKTVINKYIHEDQLLKAYFGKSDYAYDYNSLLEEDKKRFSE